MEKSTKAFEILTNGQSGEARAKQYESSIKKSLKSSILDDLELQIDAIDGQIFGLKEMSLTTDKNRGIQALSQAQCQENFNQIIDLEFEREIIERELKIKRKSFNFYFGKAN